MGEHGPSPRHFIVKIELKKSLSAIFFFGLPPLRPLGRFEALHRLPPGPTPTARRPFRVVVEVDICAPEGNVRPRSLGVGGARGHGAPFTAMPEAECTQGGQRCLPPRGAGLCRKPPGLAVAGGQRREDGARVGMGGLGRGRQAAAGQLGNVLVAWVR